ncbi:MAG: glycosyltransferase [Acidimicrobiales bacterium]
MKVLWLSGHHFEPATMGLFTYPRDVARSLIDCGAEITFIGHERDEVPRPNDPDWTLLGPTHRHTVRGQLKRHPFMISEVWDREAQESIGPMVRRSNPDVIIVDHLRSSGPLEYLREVAPIVYLSHNHEYSVKKSTLNNNPRLHHKVAYTLDIAKLRKAEQALCDAASLVTAISPIDAASYATVNGVPDHKLLLMQPAYRRQRIADRTITSDTPRRVVIVNNLIWAVKRRNTHELLDVLAKTLHDAGIELAIVGGDDTINQPTADRYPTVSFPGFVPDLEQYLSECRMAIMFEPEGGGLKMKVLDYIFNRVPIVGLPSAMAGVPVDPNVHYLAAPRSHDVGEQILASIDDIEYLNKLHTEAFDACQNSFLPDEVGRVLYDRLEEIIK